MLGHDIPPERIIQAFRLCAETGKIFYQDRPVGDFRASATHSAASFAKGWNTKFAGKEAGNTGHQGYRRISFDGTSIAASHVAWLLAHGEWPSGFIDHINGDRSDNRPSNLRVVDAQENAKNQKARYDNTSGVVGVCWCKSKRKWLARITVNYHHKNLGSFQTKAAAIACRKAAEQQYGFHPNHGRRAA